MLREPRLAMMAGSANPGFDHRMCARPDKGAGTEMQLFLRTSCPVWGDFVASLATEPVMAGPRAVACPAMQGEPDE